MLFICLVGFQSTLHEDLKWNSPYVTEIRSRWASVGVSMVTTLGTNVKTLDAKLDYFGLSDRKNNHFT